jgi:hypothetical protein
MQITKFKLTIGIADIARPGKRSELWVFEKLVLAET